MLAQTPETKLSDLKYIKFKPKMMNIAKTGVTF